MKSRKIMKLIKNSENPYVFTNILKSQQPFEKSPGQLKRFISQNFMSPIDKFIGIHYKENRPAPRSSIPLKVLLKVMPDEEYMSGRLSDKTKNRVIDKINRERAKLKNQLVDKPGDATIKTKIASTRVKIYNDLNMTVDSIGMVLGKKQKVSFNKVAKRIARRSKCRPVVVECDPYALYGVDSMSTDRADDKLLMSESLSMAIAWVGDDFENKKARAIMGCFREFKKNPGGPYAWHMSIIDINGPIRQQKRIVTTLVSIARKHNLKFYMPRRFRHRFRCDLVFRYHQAKLISYGRCGSGNTKYPEYEGVVSWVSTASKRKDLRYYVIPDVVEVLGLIQPNTYAETQGPGGVAGASSCLDL